MVTHRVLPFDEWYKAADIPPFNTGGLPNPQFWRIVVVERDGVIVAACSLFDTVHWDGFWTAEGDRGNPLVFKELLVGGLEVMQEYAIPMVHTTVPEGRSDLHDMLERFGFSRAFGRLYYYMRSTS